LRKELPAAFAAGQLVAFFQPEVDVSTGKVCGAEALVRWVHPQRGVLAPGQFLHLVEGSRLMARLTKLMLDAGLAEQKVWVAAGLAIPISVNVPPKCLTDTTFPDLIADRLHAHAVPAGMLILEVTEQAAAQASAADVAARLDAMGVRLALDDFGTGYSSLERLGGLRVGLIKLDISLVRPLLDNPSYRKIAELSIELAHQLGARVVAEGVESEAVRTVLASLGCDMAQGYFFARPMPAVEFLIWVEKNGRQLARQRGQISHRRPVPPPEDSYAPATEGTLASGGVLARIVAGLRGTVGTVGAGPLSLAVAMLTLYGLWQVERWGGHSHQALIGDLAFVPVNGAAIVAGLRASRCRDLGARTCRAWRLLTLALGSYLLGDVLQTIYENVLHERAYPSWADAAYLGFYFAAIAGVLSFPSRRLRRGQRFRLLLDMATVFVGGCALIWYVVLGPVMAATHRFDLVNLVTFAYPVGDLLLLFGVVALLLRGGHPRSVTSLRIIACGLSIFIAADVCYDWIIAHGSYLGGDPVDTLWILALTVMFLAASCQQRTTTPPRLSDPRQQSETHISRIPYLAVAIGYGLLCWVGLQHSRFNSLGGLLIAAVILTTLVSVRQLMALRDNSHLLTRYHNLAAIDPVTGLYNRRHFMEVAEQEFADAHRQDRPLAILMLDIDHFKQVNDTYGHAAGDTVLFNIAQSCRQQTRPTDTCARYGGDELMILLPGETADTAQKVATRLLTAHDSSNTKIANWRQPVTVSIGIAEAKDCRNLDALLARVDLALYRAKRTGRARTGTFQ